jgi:ABC-2 type transport system permease protein
MNSSLQVYGLACKNALASRMAYRGDFFLSSLIMLLFEFVVPLVTLLIYRSGSSFPGWSMYEALLIQAIFMIVKGIAFPFVFGVVWRVAILVREGTFDLILLKPRSVLFLTLATSIDIDDLGKLFGGLGLFSVVAYHLPPIGIVHGHSSFSCFCWH